MLPLIGIVGKARSGKDTAGQALRQFGFWRVGMADEIAALYASAAALAPYDLNTSSPGTREALQVIGVRGREVDDQLWIRYAEHRIAELSWLNSKILGNPEGVYIPNIRFLNEARWVFLRGGKLIGITGRGGLEGKAGEHETEKHVDALLKQCNAVVENTGSIQDLRDKVLELAAPWIREWGLR